MTDALRGHGNGSVRRPGRGRVRHMRRVSRADPWVFAILFLSKRSSARS